MSLGEPGGLIVLEMESNQYSFNAVSYTHLRAHETVLDLVCRLLLEKKKNIQKNYTIMLITPLNNIVTNNYSTHYCMSHS